jgi:hypothetical protein
MFIGSADDNTALRQEGHVPIKSTAFVKPITHSLLPASSRKAMFIEPERPPTALRQEGHVSFPLLIPHRIQTSSVTLWPPG